MKKLTALFSLLAITGLMFITITKNQITYARESEQEIVSVSAYVPEQLVYSIENDQLTISTNAKNWQVVDFTGQVLFFENSRGEFIYPLPENGFSIMMGY